MKRIFLFAGAALAGLLALVLVAAIAVVLLVDPNDYREDIQDAAREATGRELHLEDDLSLSLFPWLGIETGRIRLGNAPGFEGDFFSLDAADVRLRLLPLLRGRLEVAEIRVDGLRLNLAVNAEGVGNWEDLIPDTDEAPREEEAPGELDLATLENIHIGGLRLNDAALSWKDERSGLQAGISDWSLRLGSIRLGEAVTFETGLDLQLSEPAISGRLEGSGRLLADLVADRISVDEMRLALDLEGEELPLSPLAMRLDWEQLVMDAGEDRLDLHGLHGSLAEMPFAGQLAIETLSTAPRINFELGSGRFPARLLAPFLGDEAPEGLDLDGLGNLDWQLVGELDSEADRLRLSEGRLQFGPGRAEFTALVSQLGETPVVEADFSLAEFSPRRLLNDIGLAELLPETRDPGVLERFSLNASLLMDEEGIALRELEARLDDSRLSGDLALPELEPLALRFDLAIDEIDLDRYLAPDEESEAIAEDEPLDLDAIEIPVEAIRGQDVEGRFRIDRLMLAGMQLEELVAGLRIVDDRLELSPLDARLYGGRQQASLSLDASGEVPAIEFREQLSGVRIGGLLDDLFGLDRFTGLANIEMNLSGQGRTVGELRPTLSGNARLLFDEGALEGVDVAHEFSHATRAFRSGEAVRSDRGRTPFSALSASGTVEEGRLTSDDFRLNLDNLSLSGEGWLSLVDFSMDYRLAARLLDGGAEDMGSDRFDLEGRALSLRLTGTPMSPRFSFDSDGLLRQLTREATADSEARAREEARRAEERAREAQERAREEARKEAEEAEEELRERLRQRLRR